MKKCPTCGYVGGDHICAVILKRRLDKLENMSEADLMIVAMGKPNKKRVK